MNWRMNTFKYLCKCFKHKEEILDLMTAIRTETMWVYNPNPDQAEIRYKKVNR